MLNCLSSTFHRLLGSGSWAAGLLPSCCLFLSSGHTQSEFKVCYQNALRLCLWYFSSRLGLISNKSPWNGLSVENETLQFLVLRIQNSISKIYIHMEKHIWLHHWCQIQLLMYSAIWVSLLNIWNLFQQSLRGLNWILSVSIFASFKNSFSRSF